MHHIVYKQSTWDVLLPYIGAFLCFLNGMYNVYTWYNTGRKWFWPFVQTTMQMYDLPGRKYWNFVGFHSAHLTRHHKVLRHLQVI